MLTNIKSDIEKLIALYEGQKVQNEDLRVKLEKSQQEAQAYKKQIEDLEHQIDNLKLAEAFLAPTGSDSGAKAKITKLIKEIDKCISMLEK
ncbi:MAG: hypothetical protein MJZ16_10970 [Bacteroidales bacterium]|nr:hypothetical protein [Bacteroidales bacterium]